MIHGRSIILTQLLKIPEFLRAVINLEEKGLENSKKSVSGIVGFCTQEMLILKVAPEQR